MFNQNKVSSLVVDKYYQARNLKENLLAAELTCGQVENLDKLVQKHSNSDNLKNKKIQCMLKKYKGFWFR